MSRGSLFFFFQAEDGIRDDLVTGVQTCALPISAILPQDSERRIVLLSDGRQNMEDALQEAQLLQQEEIDRKSTRLNSSHQIISYAVFCLKKKKKENTDKSKHNTFYSVSWRTRSG